MSPFSVRTNLDGSDGSDQYGLIPLIINEHVLHVSLLRQDRDSFHSSLNSLAKGC